MALRGCRQCQPSLLVVRARCLVGDTVEEGEKEMILGFQDILPLYPSPFML